MRRSIRSASTNGIEGPSFDAKCRPSARSKLSGIYPVHTGPSPAPLDPPGTARYGGRKKEKKGGGAVAGRTTGTMEEAALPAPHFGFERDAPRPVCGID